MREIGDNTFSLVTFWERRIRRILPALIAVVLATLAAAWFLYLPEDLIAVGQSVLAQSVLMSNVFFFQHTGYFEAPLDTIPLLHTWSLAVEEQFYLLFPLLLMFLARYKRLSTSRCIAGLGVGSFVLSVIGSYYEPSATFYLLPTRAWELMVGAFLAANPGRQLSSQRLKEVAGLAGVGLILFSIFFYTDKTRFPGLAAVPPCLGAALIILSGSAKPTLVGRALSLRPVVFIGLISYSLYLWHWPFLVFSKYGSIEPQNRWLCVGALAASFVPAILSWRFIETPFRKRLLCPRRPQVFALAGCSMLLLVILGGGVYLIHGMPSRLPAQALAYADGRHDFGFRNQISLQQADAGEFAELGGQGTNQPVELLLWGDSHAEAVAPVLDELCRQFSVRGVQATHAATAPLLQYVSTGPSSLKEKSPVFSQSVMNFISQRHVKAVMLAAYWTTYRPPDSLNDSLVLTVQTVTASGARIYVVKDAPIPRFDVPRLAATSPAWPVLRKNILPPTALLALIPTAYPKWAPLCWTRRAFC